MPLSPSTLEALEVGRQRILAEQDPVAVITVFEEYRSVQWQACLEDPWYFLRTLAKTKNEHGADEQKYEPFPDYDYLRHMLRLWQETDAKPEGKLHLTAKSRQIMASWFACAMVLYHCMTGKAVRVGWQGKKAEDTNEMLERIYGLWERLPTQVKARVPCERRFLHLHFPSTDSDIHAIPQGEAQVRQYTWRYFISDEMGFQENAEESYYALLPALGKAGMLWVISTASPGHFETLYSSPEVTTRKVLCKGMEAWKAENGISILRLHWTADPTKSEEWADKESAKYGGRLSSYWRSEYEIDFAARRGGLVFPQFSTSTHVLSENFDLRDIEHWPKWRVIDPGYNNATAVGFFTTNDGVLYLYDELYMVGKTVGEQAPLIKAKSASTKFQYTLIDPSAFARTLAASGRSIADLYAENNIAVCPADRAAVKKDQIPALADLMVVQENNQPKFKVAPKCVKFLWEIRNYRWKEAVENQATPEEPIKINDHLIDCCLYAARAINPTYYAKKAKDPLELWYHGSNRNRRMADERRVKSHLFGPEDEP